MKKIFSLFLLMGVALFVIGCSEGKEVKIEENQDSGQNVKEIMNMDEVYEFINELNPGKYSKEDFNKWQATYLDVTGDGKEEVVFSTTYWDGKLDNLMVIEASDSGYKIIPSDIELAKYENEVSVRDGFLLISRKSGGSGMYDTSLSIYVFDGEKIKNTGLDIVLENVFSHPTGYLIKGEIEGNMYDFTYTATKEDYATEETSLIAQEGYIYDPAGMNYIARNLREIDSKGEKNLMVVDIKDLKNGDLITDDMVIENIEYFEGTDRVTFNLSGETSVSGSLIFDGDYYDAYILTIEESDLLEKAIKIKLSEDYCIEYIPKELIVANDSSIPDEYKEVLKNGGELEVEAVIDDIGFSALLESESGSSCHIVNLLEKSK